MSDVRKEMARRLIDAEVDIKLIADLIEDLLDIFYRNGGRFE